MYPDLPSKKIKDIRGERFGRLTVMSFSHIARHSGRNAFWNCSCDCTNSVTVDSSALRSGSTKSCSCLAKETSRRSIKSLHIYGQHLYLIKSGSWVKIGRANNPQLRLTQIRASNPYGAELLGIVENAGEMEKVFHTKFNYLHHTGEWFRLSNSDVNEILSTAGSSCEVP